MGHTCVLKLVKNWLQEYAESDFSPKHNYDHGHFVNMTKSLKITNLCLLGTKGLVFEKSQPKLINSTQQCNI